MKVLRKDNYEDDAGKIKIAAFPLENITDIGLKNYSSLNTLPVNKKEKDSFSTFDDGLLFSFEIGKYEHLTYYCRTETPNLDTCNVKLFKL